MLTLTVLKDTIVQIIVFSIIPFIWWLSTKRREVSFFEWVGLKKPNITNRKQFFTIFILVTLIFLLFSIGILYMMRDVETATNIFEGQGLRAIPAALIYAFIQTAFAEELFFRGFIAKSLIRKFGFRAGNILQSLIFGIVHGLIFLNAAGIFRATVILLVISADAWILGYLNEKLAGGSILPSWLSHGISNIFSSIIAMFSLI